MVEEGELDDYLEPIQKIQRNKNTLQGNTENEQHEWPTLGDLNTIARRFDGGRAC